MALSITSVTRKNGAQCDHVTVTANDEGVTRTFDSSFGEIDALFSDLGTGEQRRMLVLLWAKYRRSQGRQVIGVEIA